MSIEEIVQKSREEQRELFGELGVKTDCVHHTIKRCKDYCNLCIHEHRSKTRLQCECRVCYFYQPKE